MKLGNGIEGAQGGLSLSYFHFIVYNLEFIQGDLQNLDTYSTRKQICLPILDSSPQYSAFIRPISANKPILSTLTVGFIPSTTQSAFTKTKHTCWHRHTKLHTYSHMKTTLEEKGWKAQKKTVFLILK